MLEQRPVWVFLKYIIPSILGLLAVSSANIVDGYFVGNYVGSVGLASINIAYPIFAILFGAGLMFAVGGSVSVSKLLGERQQDQALDVFSKVIISVVLFALLACTLVYLNIEHILTFLEIEGEFKHSSYMYLLIISLFMPFIIIGIVVDYFVRADENPNLSFLALLSSAVVNIVLDYWFIVELNYGIQGAAWATGISYAVVILVLLPHFFTKRAILKLVKPSGSFKVVFNALRNGVSEFVNESSAGITVMIFNLMMIKYLGSDGVAAYTIVSYFIMVSIMISFAISDGLQPIVAKHYGAKAFTRINVFLRLATITALSFSITLVAFVLSVPEVLVNVFLDDDSLQTQQITIEFLHYSWVAFLFIGLNILMTSYLSAIHQPLASASISLSRSLLAPIALVSVLSYFFGVVGVYIAMPISEVITFFIAIYFLRKHKLSSQDA